MTAHTQAITTSDDLPAQLSPATNIEPRRLEDFRESNFA